MSSQSPVQNYHLETSLLDRPVASQLLLVFPDRRWPRAAENYMRNDPFSSVQTRPRNTLVRNQGPVR
jgi:hypothetical protein